ncbi:MAG: DUF4199 domain-containing protein [Hyphomicrobiales bacterium]
MGTVLKYGILLGALVEIWTAIVIAAGWHKDPVLLLAFYVVIPLEVVLIVLALRGTAAEATYGKQVLNGTLVSLVAGVIIVFGSVIITTVVFPNYYAEVRAAGVEMLTKAGKSAEEIEVLMRGSDAFSTPWAQAIQGFIGTVLTGILTALVAGLFLRKKAA